MPSVSITLPENTQSITRPIIIDIVNQISHITKINKDSQIFFPGDIQRMQTPGGSIDSSTERFALFDTAYRTFIEVEEDYDINALGSTAVSRREHMPVFLDNDIGIKIAPVYSSNDVTINFRYVCPSKTEALKWRDDVRMRVSELRDINLHTVTYHYPLPLEVLVIVKLAYERREAFLPYNQSFEEYVTSKASNRLTIIGDLIGQDARLAISESQTRIVGMYGFDAIPEKPERDDKGFWVINFSYKFSYEKPIACNIKYPVIVHNQLMPSNYTEVYLSNDYQQDKTLKSFPLSLHALNGFESDNIMGNKVNNDYMLRMPIFDDFIIKDVPTGTGSIFLALCEVDTTDNKTLLNLKELGDVVLDKDILQFIQESEYPYICSIYNSILNISLYRNDYITNTRTIICDSSLNIKAINELNLRNQHRLRLSVVCDLTLLTKEALDRLRKYPKALYKIISCINELLKNHPDFVSYGDKKYITELEFSPIYSMLTGYRYDNGRGTPGRNYYGPGLNISSWKKPLPDEYGNSLFRDIDKRIIDNYRKNRIGNNIVQTTGIISILQNR